ncbi:MAG: DUF4136 domain-containing protein [Proteobacteria bacterium]|nr:DUF4136 domain-containing protein [Pseudomonadota bacterium]
MNYIMQKIPLVLCLFILGACSSKIENNVTRFHELPPPNGEKIEVVSLDPALQSSLEFGVYAQMIGQRLGQFGYTPADQSIPSYIAQISYANRPLQDTIIENRSPVSVGVGVGGGSRRGTSMGVGLSTGFGNSNTKTDYISTLSLVIIKQSDGKRVYEGHVENKGRNPNLQQVMPFLVQSLFTDFPGLSGTSSRVQIAPK